VFGRYDQTGDMIEELEALRTLLQAGKLSNKEYNTQRESIWNREHFCDIVSPAIKTESDALVRAVKNLLSPFNGSFKGCSEKQGNRFSNDQWHPIQKHLYSIYQDALSSWKKGTLDERIAERTYIFKSGALKTFVDIYANRNYVPPPIDQIAVYCCWNYLETDRDRKFAYQVGLSTVLLDAILGGESSVIGAFWSFLEYDECRKLSCERGLVQKMVQFLQIDDDVNQITQLLGCLFSISCNLSCCSTIIKHAQTLSEFIAPDVMCAYFIALTFANILLGVEHIDPDNEK